MIGWDFSTFWEVGRAVLNGGNPYAVEISKYPPVTALAFAIFAVLPLLPSFAIWSGVNIIFCLSTFRRMGLNRRSWVWLFFSPVLFNLLTGQLDLFFMWLAAFLPAGGWKAVAAGVLMTLKPQVALVILPWFLVRWLRSDRKLFTRWIGLTLIFQLIPLVFSATIFQDWLSALRGVSEMKIGVSSGIFSLTVFGLPLWLAGAIALAVAFWGLFQEEKISRAAQLIACPITIWYEDVFLAGSAPALLLIPYSLLAFLAAYLLQNALPLSTIPLAVLVYRLVEQRRKRPALAG